MPINSKVDITVPGYPGKTYRGLVEASVCSVDAASGTSRMQVMVENSSGELMPGSFANTRIELPEEIASAVDSVERADLRREGIAGGDGRRQQQGVDEEREEARGTWVR